MGSSSLTPLFVSFGLFAGISLGHAASQQKVEFERQILPLLEGTCFKCHSAEAKKAKGDIELDSVSAIRAKSRSESLIFPHKPEKSLLYEKIALPAGHEDLMPPEDSGKSLSAQEVALIRRWIEQGAGFGNWKSTTPAKYPLEIEAEPLNPMDVVATARRIDELIEAGLSNRGITPNPPVEEDLWCRRVHLDLIGRIPTYDEMQAFLKSRDPQKRAKLIDALLSSKGHVSTMFNYWCDALRARDLLEEETPGGEYLSYIKTNIRENKPYDRWVSEMIDSSGTIQNEPAVGYYLRDRGNRFASVDNTSSLFLGTQIGCAQCHDHPYDKWSRRDYHEFAAWTAGVDAKRSGPIGVSEGELGMVREKLEKSAERETNNRRLQIRRGRYLDILDRAFSDVSLVENADRAVGFLPKDYQYPDGKPEQRIQPKVLFGQVPLYVEGRPSRVFASWMVSPDNPRFALTVANRMWARIMGAPFAGDIQSVKEIEECRNPALAAYLQRVMLSCRFDLRQFQRIVANTETYAREAGNWSSPGSDYDFVGPVLRRMTAEQAWDSLLTLAVQNLDDTIQFGSASAPSPGVGIAKTEESPTLEANEILAFVRAQAKKEESEERKAARKMARSEPENDEMPVPEFGQLVRASELPQPAPNGHFLRVFGQSNRETADGGWRTGTVPQTLLMLNSSFFDVVVRSGSPLKQAISKSPGDSDRLHAAFVSILGRAPKQEEINLLMRGLGGAGNPEAVAHTLLGTRQFLFIQ